MTHVTLRPEFENLIDPYAPVGQLGTGFEFTEGPIWHPTDHYLLFSDMPADVRRRWDARRGVVEVRRPSNKCNGMTYDAELNLIVCEHATSSLIRERPDGRRDVIASHFENQELNSPNDVCVHSSGAIYFSDPWYGRMPVYGVERPRQLGFQGVYRVPTGGGALRLLVDRNLFEQPNGLCFSPDERVLYVNDTVQAVIRAFDVEADGALANPRIFASNIRSEFEPGVPDGMKCDQHGNVWVTAPGGVWVYSRNGELLGKVRLPELVANLAWGGADFRTLYLAATHSVYAVPTKVGPRHEPYMSGEAAACVRNRGPDAVDYPASFIAGAVDQRRQRDQAEGDHSQRYGDEIPGDVGLQPDHHKTSEYCDGGPQQRGEDGGLHSPGGLSDAVERIAYPEEAEERPDPVQIFCTDLQHRRILAENPDPCPRKGGSRKPDQFGEAACHEHANPRRPYGAFGLAGAEVGADHDADGAADAVGERHQKKLQP